MLKRIIKKIPYAIEIHRFIKWSYYDSSKSLIFIHIGKCGGATLNIALRESSRTKKYSKIHKIHVSKPPILKNTHYVFILRDPIQRTISAFNWRYKKVVIDEIHKYRFAGEYEILKKYNNINSLAEALYRNGNLDLDVEKELNTILHIKHNISFYLKELLKSLQSNQIFGVFTTENLNNDIFNQLKTENLLHLHENSSSTNQKYKDLSLEGLNNLKTYLSEDFKCIETLLKKI
jgi:hypothetical protein